MPNQASPAATKRSGVWDADAPDGYVAIVAYENGHRILRLEVARELYVAGFAAELESWLRSRRPLGPKLVP